jgi:hypothetical protein
MFCWFVCLLRLHRLKNADWHRELIGSDAVRSGNQVLGFHGTKHNAVDIIAAEGLDQRVAGTGHFGFGIYIAENASKSDEYTDENANGERVMLVVRSCLGIVFEHHGDAQLNTSLTISRDGRTKPLQELMRAPFVMSSQADSLQHVPSRRSGNKESWPWKNSEIVVYDRTQVYPELLITYKRVPL